MSSYKSSTTDRVTSHPLQIQLLAEGHLNYRDLYDTVLVKVAKKKGTMSKTPTASKFKFEGCAHKQLVEIVVLW